MTHAARSAIASLAFAALSCSVLGAVSGANAQTFSSSYTSAAPGDCRVFGPGKDEGDDGTMRVCPGKAGLVVVISESDLREVVSVGRNRIAAAKEPASDAWFSAFNSAGNTIEWRALDGRPFAIIQRWRMTDHSERDKEDRPSTKNMLAVTRLAPGPVCHVAYIDVKANPEANELARKTADEFARDFQCGKDKIKVVGNRGRAVELATSR
jgi:hypothetical protein